MYKSPIDVYITNIQTQLLEQQENQIYQAIQKCGVNVDEVELIKALNYDRNQYQKGYNDAVKEFTNELLEKFEEHYKHSPTVMKTIEEVIKEVLGGEQNEWTTQ